MFTNKNTNNIVMEQYAVCRDQLIKKKILQISDFCYVKGVKVIAFTKKNKKKKFEFIEKHVYTKIRKFGTSY
jgi:hypothetical protein